MKKKVVKTVCMVMLTGVMLAGCGKSAEKPAEQEVPVEAQVEESADQAENKDQSAVDVTSVEATSEEDFVIEALDDGTVQITKYKGTDAEVVIPDTISGKKVTVIGGFHNDYLESVILPDSVIEISDEAFSECTNLANVSLSSNLQTIGKEAFRNCSRLKNIEFPSSLVEVKEYAFWASGLTNVTMPDNVKVVESSLFIGCRTLETVILNEGIESINEKAFAGCKVLQKVYIPSTVTYIDASAFNDVDTVTIVTTTGSYAETYANENGIPCEIQ